MKKLLCMAILILVSACSTPSLQNNFNGRTEELNSWAGRASLQDLCDSMTIYSNDKVVLDRILVEFRNRNMSYLYCDRYYIKN